MEIAKNRKMEKSGKINSGKIRACNKALLRLGVDACPIRAYKSPFHSQPDICSDHE
jgi:hypothetical protein